MIITAFVLFLFANSRAFCYILEAKKLFRLSSCLLFVQSLFYFQSLFIVAIPFHVLNLSLYFKQSLKFFDLKSLILFPVFPFHLFILGFSFSSKFYAILISPFQLISKHPIFGLFHLAFLIFPSLPLFHASVIFSPFISSFLKSSTVSLLITLTLISR